MPSSGFVYGFGSLNASIAIVGEQPGKQEVREGRPFVGPAGDNLEECLQRAGIRKADCYLTNVIKDLKKPIGDYVSVNSKGVAKLSLEGRAYIDMLRDELSNFEGNVVVAAGNIALFALCDRIGITKWRGSIIESTLIPGLKVVPVLHPATYTWEKLHKTPSAYLNKYLIAMDLRKAKDESEYPEFRRKDRQIFIKPSFSEALEFIGRCETIMQEGGIIDYDIELHNMELSCIGFATDASTAMCIPFIGPGGDYFTPEQELQLMLRIEQLMENPTYQKRGQYVIFDSHFLLRKYGIRTHNLHDTMVAQKILYPEFKVGLDFITAMWTDMEYYKADGKIWILGDGSWDKGWRYNGLDCIACAEAHPQQMEELEEEGNQETYQRQVALIEPLTYMMERGIRVDTWAMQRAYEDHGDEIWRLQNQLNELVGRELNPNSSPQLQQYFYEEKKVKPFLKQGKPTADEDAMKRLMFQGFKEADLILKIRKLVKRRSTYLTTAKIDADSRIRCAYNPVGTRYSRISSGENIFGTGMNLQNWPNDLLTYLVCDEGYIFYSFDYAQFENRIVAYVGDIPEMIEVFESGGDTHRKTASLIFNKPYEEISNAEGSCSLGNGERSERYFGKTANHAFNYGLGPGKYSLMYEVPLSQAKWVYSKYHEAYPRVQGGFWKHVEDCLRDNRTLTNLVGRKVKFWGKWSQSLLNQAYSCIPQGTCGDLINERGINYIYYNHHKFESLELLTQVHDSIGFQIPLDVPLVEHARMLLDIKESLTEPISFQGRKFEVPVDLTIGFTLNKADGVEMKGSAMPNNPIDLAAKLEEVIEHELIPF